MTHGVPDAAHDRRWQIGEVVFGIPFTIAVALEFAFPLAFPAGFRPFAIPSGCVLILGGIAFVALARRELGRRGQPTDPGHPTSRIVTTGVFAISRNPIYLGAALVLAGIALVLRMPWVLIFLPPSVVACRFLLVTPEEKYLAARLPAEYRRYASAVHRWLGRRRGAASSPD